MTPKKLHMKMRQHEPEWFETDVPDYDDPIDDLLDRRPVTGCVATIGLVVLFGSACYFIADMMIASGM